MSTDSQAWLERTDLVVCVGAGGVGKTTTAAAIALHAARSGRRAMVLTIDPAKRLANSLGLQSMGGEPQRIDLSAVAPLAGHTEGELWAAMLDSRSTFDALIDEVAPSEAVRDRILANHVYRQMADTFAGSQDYMATEKLHDVVKSGRFDLVVLDTPPVKNALDFLEAPARVVSFLDEKVLGWLLKPYRKEQVWTQRLLGGASTVIFRLMGAVFGKGFLDDLTEFLSEFQGLYDGFRQRHQAVMALLNAERTRFVVVTAPTESSVDVAAFFWDELRRRRLPLDGLIVNQRHHAPPTPTHSVAELASQLLATGMSSEAAAQGAAWLRQSNDDLAALAAAEGRRLAALPAVRRPDQADGVGLRVEVPRLPGEVHDLASLSAVGEAVFSVRSDTFRP